MPKGIQQQNTKKKTVMVESRLSGASSKNNNDKYENTIGQLNNVINK